MSRRTIPAAGAPRFELCVGWDAPMNTYFFQLFDNEADEDAGEDYCYKWSGYEFDMHQDPQEVLDLARPFAAAYDEEAMRKTLLSDRENRVMR